MIQERTSSWEASYFFIFQVTAMNNKRGMFRVARYQRLGRQRRARIMRAIYVEYFSNMGIQYLS